MILTVALVTVLASVVSHALTEPQQQPAVAATTQPALTVRPALENPAYDPTMYQQFLPQDAVQQYVHSYNGGVAASNNYQMPQTFVPYNPNNFAPMPQKAFEAYLVPDVIPVEKPSLFGSFRSVIPSARSVFSFFGTLVSLVVGSMAAVGLGTVLTALLCFFTPFCTLSFRSAKLQGVSEATQEVINVIGEQVTADRVKRAAEFVKVAIDKFQMLNQQVREATERKAVENRSVARFN